MQWIKHENQNSLKTVVTEIDFFLCSWEETYRIIMGYYWKNLRI